MSSSALVIGAGVFGLTTACELRRRRWTVTVVDAGRVPREEAASTDVSRDHPHGLRRRRPLYRHGGSRRMPGWDLNGMSRWSPPALPSGRLRAAGSVEPMRQRGGFEFESYSLLKGRGHPVARLPDLDRSRGDSCLVRRALPRRLLQPPGRLGGKRPGGRTLAARGARPGRPDSGGRSRSRASSRAAGGCAGHRRQPATTIARTRRSWPRARGRRRSCHTSPT